MQKAWKLLCIILALSLLAGCRAVAQSSSDSTGEKNSTIPSEIEKPRSLQEDSAGASATSVPGDLKAIELWAEPYPVELCRGWHASEVLAAGFSDRYLLLEDGTFYFAANEMTGAVRLRYMDGTWIFEDGNLLLTVKRKIVVEGGVEIPGYASLINDIEGGQHVKYELEPEQYEYILLPVSLATSEFHFKVSIRLGEQQFWGGRGAGNGGADYDELPEIWDRH